MKVMLIVFFDRKGIVYAHFLPDGHKSVTSTEYQEAKFISRGSVQGIATLKSYIKTMRARMFHDLC